MARFRVMESFLKLGFENVCSLSQIEADAFMLVQVPSFWLSRSLGFALFVFLESGFRCWVEAKIDMAMNPKP